MKKLLFGLIATVMFGFAGNAQKKPTKITKFWPEIDIAFGQNTYINGKVVPCINSGLCYIRVNKNASPGTIKDFPTKGSFLVLDDEGSLYVVAHTDFERVEFKERIEMISETNFDSKTLELINKEILSINPSLPKFTGVKKGTLLNPINDGAFNYLKLN